MTVGARPVDADTEALAESIAARVDALYLRHHARVYGIALHYGGGDHDWAEDVTQDVFFTLLEKLDSLPDRGDLGPWLRRVTINRCITLQRRRNVRNSPYLRWMLGPPAIPEEPETRLDVGSELRRIWRALEGLPPKQRAVFCLHHLDGQSQTAIARMLGHSDGYVSKLMRRAEAHVRRRVEAGGGDD